MNLRSIFRHFDRDRSGSIDGQELTSALHQFGFNLSPQALLLVERKYGMSPRFAFILVSSLSHAFSRKDLKASASTPYGSQGITFDRFVRCCVVIKQLTESFQRLDTAHTGTIHLSYDQFMQTVLAAP